jgi:hypothetical protein
MKSVVQLQLRHELIHYFIMFRVMEIVDLRNQTKSQKTCSPFLARWNTFTWKEMKSGSNFLRTFIHWCVIYHGVSNFLSRRSENPFWLMKGRWK